VDPPPAVFGGADDEVRVDVVVVLEVVVDEELVVVELLDEVELVVEVALVVLLVVGGHDSVMLETPDGSESEETGWPGGSWK
jgi:hypothetical protein